MQDDDNRFVAADPHFPEVRFKGLAAIAAEGPEGIADGDGEIDPGDDAPAAYLLGAVAECGFDDPRQAMNFADAFLYLKVSLCTPAASNRASK